MTKKEKQELAFHKRWLKSIRTTFKKDQSVKVEMLKADYKAWCVANETDERETQLWDFFEAEETSDEALEEKEDSGGKISKTKKPVKIEAGQTVSYLLPALSKYFDNLMKARDTHISVAIFDPEWILADKNYMTSKRQPKSSCTTNTIPYIGLQYPHEWRLSFGAWTVRFALMVRYHREIYDKIPGNDPLAPRLEEHKKIVLKIKADSRGAWTPAFRYDIANRRSVWEHRLPNGSMADIGVLNEDIMRQAITDSEFFKEDYHTDNPYILTGKFQNKSPIDGKWYNGPTSWDSFSNATAIQNQMGSGAGAVVAHLAASTSSSGSKSENTYQNRNHRSYNNRFTPYKRNNGNRHNQMNYNNNMSWKNPRYNNHQSTFQNEFYQNQNNREGSDRNGSINRGRGNSQRGGTYRPRPGIGPGSFSGMTSDPKGEEANK
ncbi:hypothetical protein DFH28DRAFT_887379 [Melampsora americana]|nr:hypothetical protein DFH28DRAFT_887379 [Melampsora americana]